MAWPPRFLYTSGRLCVDFAHTGGEGEYARFERLLAPRDLSDWFRGSSLAVEIRRVSPARLKDARRLRATVWNGAQKICRSRVLSSRIVRDLEAFAARPDLIPALDRLGITWASGSTATQALSSVARDALHLFGGESRHRLRRCQNPRCPLLFVDSSRPGRRRWCTMRRCGNLEKTARYRKSRKQAAGEKDGKES